MGNNLACTLEEKSDLTNDEKKLMILAAQTGRKYWQIAGTWENVKAAEERLSLSYIKAGDPERAREHARKAELVSKPWCLN